MQGSHGIIKMLLNGFWKSGDYVATQNIPVLANYGSFKITNKKQRTILLGDPVSIDEVKEVGSYVVGKIASQVNGTDCILMMNKATKERFVKRGAPACETFMYSFLHHAIGMPIHESCGWLSAAERDRFDEFDAASFVNRCYHLQMHIDEPFVFPPIDPNVRDAKGLPPIEYALEEWFKADKVHASSKWKSIIEEFLNARPCKPFKLTDEQRESNKMGKFYDMLLESKRWDLGTEAPYLATTGLWHPRDHRAEMLSIQGAFPAFIKAARVSKETGLRRKRKEIEVGLYPLINIIVSFLEQPGWWYSLLVMASVRSDIHFVALYGEKLDSYEIMNE